MAVCLGGVAHMQGKGHQLSRAVLMHTVHLVSNVECSWRDGLHGDNLQPQAGVHPELCSMGLLTPTLPPGGQLDGMTWVGRHGSVCLLADLRATLTPISHTSGRSSLSSPSHQEHSMLDTK